MLFNIFLVVKIYITIIMIIQSVNDSKFMVLFLIKSATLNFKNSTGNFLLAEIITT